MPRFSHNGIWSQAGLQFAVAVVLLLLAPQALAEAAPCNCKPGKSIQWETVFPVALALLPWAGLRALRFAIYRRQHWWAFVQYRMARGLSFGRGVAAEIAKAACALRAWPRRLLGLRFLEVISCLRSVTLRGGSNPRPPEKPEEKNVTQRRHAWMRARRAFLHRMHDRPTPLFAVAVERTTRSEPSRLSLPRSRLIPYGIGAQALPVGASVGALAGLSVIYGLGGSPGRLWLCAELAGAAIVGMVVCLTLLKALLLSLASGPIDDLIRHTPVGERAALMEGAGLLHLPDGAGGQLGVVINRQELNGLWYGILPMRFRPARLQSLTMFRRHNFQRVILCLGLARVLLGRGERGAPAAGPLGNRNFVVLYFGHALALYTLLVAAVLFTSFADKEPRGDAFRVLAVGLFYWWGSVVSYALGPVHREMAMLREDLREFPAFLPATLERENAISALLDLLTAAQSRWMPGLVSASSTVMLIAALTVMQVLGAD